MSNLVADEICRLLAGIDVLVNVSPSTFEGHISENHPKYLLLTGPELWHYKMFRDACARAQAAAMEAAKAQQELRKAIEELGRTVAPASKAE